MDGFKDRLIITLRFIYDINFIYLLSLLIIFLVFLPLVLGYDGKYDLIYTSFEIIGFDRDNEISFIIQFLIIPIYNFLDWLMTGKYHILPKSVTKLIKGRKFLILKTFTALLILLYLTSLLTGMYVTNQKEKVAEERRIAQEIESKRLSEIARQKAEERRLRAEQAEKEKQERIEKKRLSETTYPYQGLSCKANNEKLEDIVLVLKKNNDETKFEIDLRTRDITLDGVMYDFETILNRSIRVTEAEFKINLDTFVAGGQIYNLGEDFSTSDDFELSRSSLELIHFSYGSREGYKCKQTSHKDLYDFVENHNAKITDKNKI